ncbi:MAG TPA: TadE/TadG family type IV pilus assembly protein [Devosiaceae bacterium]|jgi:Flp pilus assembly protein TadG|nr:TadE/TadG family type IV pilus assembly protein [Devosiaceae bacterium]
MSRCGDTARSLPRLLRRFGRARDGAAAVEFALIMPMLLVLYLGSIEVTQLISADQRVTTVAATIGDLVARANGEIDSGPLNDYFAAAQSIMQPYASTGLTQVITVLSVNNTTGVNQVLWSQPFNGGTARIKGQAFPANATLSAMTGISQGTSTATSYIVVAEATYPYQPLLNLFFKSPFTLYHQTFYLPRYASEICYNVAPPC